jgi:hypothetical protein
MTRKWLSRLAMSFVVLAAALGWDALRPGRPDPNSPRVWVEGVAAALSFGLGMAGMRERHRRE